MTFHPDPWWPLAVLAAALLADAFLSIRPPRFIRDCLDGVGFPRDWWWALVIVKLLCSAGLILGIFIPGVGLAAAAGAVTYFLVAAVAHIRARFLKQEFWVNCLGMLTLSVVASTVPYL